MFLSPDEVGLKRWERALIESGFTIEQTHAEVGRVHFPPAAQKGEKQRTQWLKSLFSAMQAPKWSPCGEVRNMQVKRRLSHVSMSIGDAVQIGRHIFVACLNGFVYVQESARLIPPGFECGDEDLELLENDAGDDGKEGAPNSKASKKKGGGGSKEATALQEGADDGAGGNGKGAKKKGKKRQRRWRER